jgi:hypothetical protein
MIAMLMVMSNMDLSHDQMGLVGLDLSGLTLVGLVRGMQQVQSLCAQFGYRWDAYGRWSVLAIGVTHVSLRPLITVGNLGAWPCLDIV